MCQGTLNAQSVLEGEVSFVTSGNTYVRFTSTENISEKDTLWINQGGVLKACLIVKQKSSSSCVCEKLDDCSFQAGDKIVYKQRTIKVELEDKEEDLIEEKDGIEEKPFLEVEEKFESETRQLKLQKINARLSASTYSTLDDRENRHRGMMRFSLNAFNLNDSRFSFETYLNLRQEFTSDSVQTNVNRQNFRIYNVAVSYDLDSLSRLTLGRKINRKMSSIGAIDGLQLDKSFNDFFAGFVLGFRPDHTQFNLNTNLLQYGVYAGKNIRSNKAYGQLTFGILEQRNNGFIDRRYAYGQFNSSLFRKLNIFTSAEMDLYSKVNEVETLKPRLTNLYASLNYRFSRKISLMLSYDSRKNIIFYETFRTEVDRLLADDEARQGVRLRLSVRPMRMLYVGLSYSRRFQSNSDDKFDNINAFASISRLPGIGGRISITFNRNTSSYLQSQIYSARYNTSLIPRKLDLDLYYRRVDYLYLNYENRLQQQYYGAGLNWRIAKSLSLNVFGEMTQSDGRDRFRINTKLIKRF